MLKIDILPSTSFAKEEGYYLSGFVSAWISSWLHLKKDEGRQILLILIPCYSYVWGGSNTSGHAKEWLGPLHDCIYKHETFETMGKTRPIWTLTRRR